jgi:lysylphosphatidylglycerol synthetase-like protein (DUF2156 family)
MQRAGIVLLLYLVLTLLMHILALWSGKIHAVEITDQESADRIAADAGTELSRFLFTRPETMVRSNSRRVAITYRSGAYWVCMVIAPHAPRTSMSTPIDETQAIIYTKVFVSAQGCWDWADL